MPTWRRHMWWAHRPSLAAAAGLKIKQHLFCGLTDDVSPFECMLDAESLREDQLSWSDFSTESDPVVSEYSAAWSPSRHLKEFLPALD